MSITASMVRELRERTGAGMMECKKALVESNGDMEAAITAMRKNGQAKAAKRAGKTAAEGAITIATNENQQGAFIAETNCETDFVALDANFRQFADAVAEVGLSSSADSVEALLENTSAAFQGKRLEEARTDLVAKIGENIQVRRIALLESTGIVGSYLHGTRIGVLVALDKANEELARDIAMHIAATNPQAVDAEGVDPALIANEKEIFSAQAKESGKPDNIIEKMVEGRISKFLKEICLVDQPFIKDPEKTVAQLLKAADASVVGFVRFEVGEGIEKESVDFAEEVKAQLRGME